jgi:hypothetical protein
VVFAVTGLSIGEKKIVMRKYVANVMKGCIERTHLLISVKNTYLYVLLMKISVEFDTRCEIYFIICRLPKRESFVNIKLNRKFIACSMFL